MSQDPHDIPASGLDPSLLAIARSVRDAGGRALLVGGWVRDLVALRLRGGAGIPPAEELDLEVYGLAPERLRVILARSGEVNLVGQSFAVYKVSIPKGPGMGAPLIVDVSLPRRETKRAPGHRGFEVEGPNVAPRVI